MLLKKQIKLQAEDTQDWREIIKYAKAYTNAAQHNMKHGEAVALLDLDPWGDCNEAALVEDYVSTAPGHGKIKKKRRLCPAAASVLFNHGGPEITGAANMKAIAAFEKEKAEKLAVAAAKKTIRTRKKVQKRQDSTQAVVNMIIQDMLASKNPPEQFYDANRCPVTKKFLPNFYFCKSFMQV